MTEPAAPVTPVTKPTKTIVASIGAVLTVVVPLVTSLLTYLPPQWSAVITGAIGVLTVLGVYTIPNTPTGQVVITPEPAAANRNTTEYQWQPPWPKP
ncbi:MAG: hypothetical protein ACSLE6_07385 [Mycobacterium sp.]